MADILFNIQAYVSAFVFLLAAVLWHTNGTEKAKNERVITISYLLLLILLLRSLTFVPMEIARLIELSVMVLVMLGTMILSISDYLFYRETRKADLMTIIEPPEDIPPKERVLPSYAEDEEEVMKWEFAKQVLDPYLQKMNDKKKEIEADKRAAESEIKKKETEVKKLETRLTNKEEDLKVWEAKVDKKYSNLEPTKKKLKTQISKSRKLQSLFKKKIAKAEDLEEASQDNFRKARLASARSISKENKATQLLVDIRLREKKVLEELRNREQKLFDFEDKLEDDYKKKLRDGIEAERRRLRNKHVKLDSFEMDLKKETEDMLKKQSEIKDRERHVQVMMNAIDAEKTKNSREAEKLASMQEEINEKRSQLKKERALVANDIRKAQELEDLKADVDSAKRKLESQKEKIKSKKEEIAAMEDRIEDEKDTLESEKAALGSKIKDFSKREAKFEKERDHLMVRLNEIDSLRNELGEKENELKKEREKVRILQKTIRSETFK